MKIVFKNLITNSAILSIPGLLSIKPYVVIFDNNIQNVVLQCLSSMMIREW